MKKHLIKLSLVVATAFLYVGCASDTTTGISTPPGPNPTPGGTPIVSPAADPIVVNAEKTLVIARDTFRLLVHLERDHEAYLLRKVPEIHDYADYIRMNDVKWLRTLEAMKTAYKNHRTPENKFSLSTALATVEEALHQSQNYIDKTGLQK